MSIRKRLIGYGVTDSNGVANASYTGKGYGEIDVQAELKGEMLFHYIGTGGTETDTWSAQTGSGAVTITSDSGGTTFTSTGSSTGWIWANKQGVTPSTTQGVWTGDFTIELDVVSMTGTANVTVYESSVTGAKSQTFALSIGHWKVTRNGSTFTVTHDGATSIVTKALTDPVRIGITHIQSGKAVTFKNFAIYKHNNDLLSDEKEILDCIFYDEGTSSNHNDNWGYGVNTNVNRGNTYTTISETGTTSAYWRVKNNESISGDICIEWDNYILPNGQDYFIINGTKDTAYNMNTRITVAECHSKITLIGDKLNWYVDGVAKTVNGGITRDSNGAVKLRFQLNDGANNIGYANFKVYPI